MFVENPIYSNENLKDFRHYKFSKWEFYYLKNKGRGLSPLRINLKSPNELEESKRNVSGFSFYTWSF